jgi:threonine/homoserine/homoserine lactone efflux protein
MNMADYAIFLIAFAAAAALPGPEIAALLSRSLSGGVASSLPLALGLILGKVIMLSAAVLGLGALLALMGPAFDALKFAGAAYLVWIGVSRMRNAGKLLAAAEGGEAARPLAEVGLGLALTTSNPLALAFYMALLPTVMDMSGVTLGDYFALLAIIVCVTLAVVLGYGLVGEACRKLFHSREAKAHVDRASGTIMIGAALLIALR